MKVSDRLLREGLDTAIDFSIRRKEGHEPKKRNFDESIDLIINLKDLDLNDPNQRIDKELILPNPVEEDRKEKLCIIADGEILLQAKKMDVDTMSEDDLERLNQQEKRDKKKFVKKYDFFIVESRLMPTLARYLARFLGPRGKMPKPFPAGYGIISSVDELRNAVDRYDRIVRIQVKKTPIVQVKVGKKSMEMEKLFENIQTIVDFVVDQMPHKYNNIRSIYIKTTMGRPVKVEEEFLEEVGE
jgi:large subunit ribosomal protein L1